MHETPEQIRSSVIERFAKIACSPQTERKFPVGPESAKSLGYAATEIDSLPASLTESFAGVGNPLALGPVHLAARGVGPTGKVIGIDLTAEMVEKSRRNAATIGVANAEFREGDIEALPVDSSSVDLVLSNGVFNLCPDKPKVLSEVFRVLRPGGRLQMADILLEDRVTPEEIAKKGEWSD